MSELLKRSHEDWVRAAKNSTPEGRMFVDGDYRPALSGETFESRTPRDGSVIAEVARGSAADVDSAVRVARSSFEDGRWRSLAPRARKQIMLRWAELVREHTEELALLETLDVGKPIAESVRVDVSSAAFCLQWYAEALDKIYDEVAPSGEGTLVTITREPLGVVGAVVPWNYPLIIASWKLAPALAAGNSVVLKPAEQSSLSALLLARLAIEAGVPAGVFNVVPGLGVEAGQALGRHPDVDKIAFTGSGDVGKLFLQYAGESNGKQVQLEAGGKSPQLVLADSSNLPAAAEAIAWGICYNAGQTCNAGSRLLADRAVKDELLSRVLDVTARFVVGDPLDPTTTMGPIVDQRQLDTVLTYIDLGREDGADLIGGRRLNPDSGGYFVEPAVLDKIANTSRVAQEEIFGPVLSVLEFDGVEEGLAMANQTVYGLAASVWTKDLATAHRVAGKLRAGTVWVNTFDATDVFAPFGGFKASGSGRDKSLHAMDEYSALKTTWIDFS
ncbi:gamma-glutamyl-gamma-aminobutyraldehyde dehydrogenase/4-guanidinobutyraldehyde dehydrogenase / NAD-dependent aldehyde dehydrogenase [Amycolatopsis marina]|uniref:Gamma-glutamyl-gamma-aminobutyraldehyde dehydrogenase/4-guanidinobutyraldehyde dehydrogenase / NAD-dependent aldehyde dehydrogenase n=1 Tax=Amycolatopsis marina TaxID=490629 RepID=A0A1I0Y253_9PSEU|nr:aldehyde dehydrogenase [Amycolatopsis marina]SFB07429.1 gamma-glutamyl-gamma-aminobutyraldehyde dehydrogenase/4-guanidinobutyraldehyde dehydrogenase / NAD-dependent aldehyde dehydrogenase [Amycolatopsis marina]